ncbi:MAG: hypothetical protein AB1673_02225 [Actinomycetota bacterium]
MLISIEEDRDARRDAVSVQRHLPPRPSRPGVRALPTGHLRLWAAATVLTLVASTVAMSRIGLLGFALGLGPGRVAAEAEAATVELPPSLPFGKGMWMWQPDKSDGGDVGAIVARAREVGLTHIYVRTGSSWNGFYAGPFLDQVLPAAHAAGIRVYGWDFPRLIDTGADVARAAEAINYRTPDGHRIDGFSADIETRSEGTHINAAAATAYGDGLREVAGEGYPLIATVPRPSNWTKAIFPYAEVVARFDAIAPMVYWLNRQPDTDVAGAMADLAQFGKPIFPVGQAYDGAPEGGRPGVPPPDELQRFMRTAHEHGAQGVSFWSWQAADQRAWDTIRDAPEFSR